MKTKLIALATGAALLMGCASTSMKGVVKDRDTGTPVPGAIVQVEDRTALTDTRGYYAFDEIEPQDFYRVTVAAPNYHAVSESIAPRDGDDEERIVRDFLLVEQPPRVAIVETEAPETQAAQGQKARTTVEAGAERPGTKRTKQNLTISTQEGGDTDVDLTSEDEDTPQVKIRLREKAE